MTQSDDPAAKTPECWMCGALGEIMTLTRSNPVTKRDLYRCADNVACDNRISYNLKRATNIGPGFNR